MPEQPEPPPIIAQEGSFHHTVEQPDRLQELADRIGFVPSTRFSDNHLQVVAGGIGILIGTLTFLLLRWPGEWLANATVGAFIGLVAATFFSGFYLMVKNMTK